MHIDPTLLIYILIALGVMLIGWIVRLEMRINKLLIGKDSRSLEDSLVSAKKDIEHLHAFKKDSLNYFSNVEDRLSRSVQSVESVRFNPFKGSGEGGNQSFATAFVSEKGDGVVISSLYSRERVSVFSKPIKKFESTFELTEEEQSVISKSQSTLKGR
ncbi:MAG: DUF4446 family protein [Candidatus Zambryskibacteria bacterium]|nr:DUF4446 family protein [Candidatus Zambryskibacteria bacterium]